MLSWPDINANIPDDLGQTPVHLAAMCGRGSSLRLLLDKGGDLGILDKNGKSPIQLANGDDDSMNVILMHQFSAMISHYHLKGVKGTCMKTAGPMSYFSRK
jgi:ankyrin repeat protein